MFVCKIALLFIIIYLGFAFTDDIQLMDGSDLIKDENYPLEIHEVETEDGYILILHRIPHGKNNDSALHKPPVLIVHGLAFSSSAFLVHGAKLGIGFLLADAGFDVWLMNARGNDVSYKHKTLDRNIDTKKFYNFSFHEIGIYDIPASIDYILNATQEKKLHYVGYSQGGTTFYVMACLRPSYNSKIKLATLMAPSSIMKHTYGVMLRLLTSNIFALERLAQFLGIYHIPYVHTFRKIAIRYGHNPLFRTLVVRPIHQLIYEENLHLSVEESLKLYYYQPNDCSLRQLFHYGQMIDKGEFQHYDYGEKENLRLYNDTSPTKYDLTKVTAPIALYHGENDFFIPPEDIEIVSKLLPNVVRKKYMEGYTHTDFTHDVNVVDRLYNDLIKFMKLY